MKMCDKTIKILKNFSSINQSILFRTGSTIRTKSALDTIAAQAVVEEMFPFEFGIYDLNQFLSVISLFEDPDFDFQENHVTISSGESSSNYYYTDKDMIVAPKNVTPEFQKTLGFNLTESDVKSLIQAASVMQLPNIVIESEADKQEIVITARDPKNPTSNNFTKKVGETMLDTSFRYVLLVDNIKLLPHSYDVSIISDPGMIVEFSSKYDKIKYWAPVEQGSNYGS
tara:strand:+ start:404 stop:1084 length:681 start_codon:yes stop_codon:yes gene_type:complete